jgi:predicted outer membrane repeat protein
LISDSRFISNQALTAGGAVSVTERKVVTVINSSFLNNQLFWRELAAGGGLYCFLCTSVNITSSAFSHNRAAYGGGAAVLQPWQPSVLTNTTFSDNVALPDPTTDLGQVANRRLRHLLAGSSPYAFSGSKAVNPQRMGGQAAAVSILGPLGANVTGDSGYYTGGGGLYVSLSSGVNITQCAFLYNTAYNGGEVVL